MKDRQALFWPTHVDPESDTFTIDFDSQMTVTAIGLQAGDEITFQMVYVPSVDPDKCTCPPGKVTLPSVAAYAELTCCGEPVKVTAENLS